MKFSNLMSKTMRPPIVNVRQWLNEITLPDDLPLIDLSQAAPADPPHEDMRAALARFARDDESHVYGPVLGRADLRAEVARQWSVDYQADLDARHVAVTAGCNQAYCAAIAAVAAPGDTVLLVAPYYFNHAMRLHYAGINIRCLDVGATMLPDIAAAEATLDDTVRAIVLVSPNNPTGAEYPAELLLSFYQLARRCGIALIIDETYRNFRTADGPAHALFRETDWEDVFIHLYSFSKDYRMTGHRVGALIAGPAVLSEVEKYLDTETICVNQLGQRAALFGLTHLQDDVAHQRSAMAARAHVMARAVENWDKWDIQSCGAYFAYMRHPFAEPSEPVARALLEKCGILTLPGGIFAPAGNVWAAQSLRLAFANVGIETLKEVSARIIAFNAGQQCLKLA